MQIILTILGYEGHCNTETCNTQQLIIIFIRVGLYTICLCTISVTFYIKRWFSICYTTYSVCMCGCFCGSCYINLL